MTDKDTFEERGYGSLSIGFGEKPGIVVVDFQVGFTDPQYPLGGAPLIERGVTNTARLLDVARRCGVPVATCYTAYTGERDFQYGYRTIVPEDCVGDHDEGPHRDNLRDVERRYADISSADEVIGEIEHWRRRNQH